MKNATQIISRKQDSLNLHCKYQKTQQNKKNPYNVQISILSNNTKKSLTN